MSKEKQIEEMAKALCDSCPDNDGLSYFLSNYRMCPTVLKDFEHLYKMGYRKQSEWISVESEWISVEERLPECERGAESKAVLFITKQGFMYTGYYGCGGIFHDRYFREFKNATEGYDILNVTHWMPLPEPPKKGGAE